MHALARNTLHAATTGRAGAVAAAVAASASGSVRPAAAVLAAGRFLRSTGLTQPQARRGFSSQQTDRDSKQQQQQEQPQQQQQVELPSRTRCVVVSNGDGGGGPPLQTARLSHRHLHTPPQAHELVVRVKAAAVNPIDTMMCGGYGRALVSLAQKLGDLSQFECPVTDNNASGEPSEDTQLYLGREGVGEVVALGSALQWNSSGWRVGQRVWFSPRVGGSQGGAFAEFVSLRADLEVGKAPPNLSDPEAAMFPFSICTAWTALVDCAGMTPAPLPSAAAAAAMGSSMSSKTAAAARGNVKSLPGVPFYVLRSLGVDPSTLQSGVSALSSLPVVGGMLSSVLPPMLSPSAPRKALVHGASGSVGLVAVQLLQRWGYEVYATTLGSTRRPLDELLRKQKEAALTNEEDWGANNLPPIHIIDTSAQTIESVVQERSLSVFLDGVGGDRVFEQALSLLAKSGQLVTLRGEGVLKVDEVGLVKGAFQATNMLVDLRSRAAARGIGYHWAISTPNSEAMDYVGALVRANLWQHHLQPIAVWDGLDKVPHALQEAHDEAKLPIGPKPRHVVIIAPPPQESAAH